MGQGACHAPAPSGDPTIPVEVREAKLVWIQIRARTKCGTESSNEEKDDDDLLVAEEVDEEEEYEEGSQELL
eukprot:8122753-Ditylum_brightwellii.AAC.1